MNGMPARLLLVVLALALASACGGGSSNAPPPKPCDQQCKDESAMRALRETVKLAFNLTLQGKPVGTYDITKPCPVAGTVEVKGTATSNAVQGATEVTLSYVLVNCTYLLRDSDPKNNYKMSFTGTLSQEGVLAVQPTATTALVMKSAEMKLEGTVSEPPLEYREDKCPVDLGQNGNRLFGTVCGRSITVSL